jgi:ABC-2 type transport system ATP-binding protein
VRVFSNGMKQRLLIARALLHRPLVLFLDEPSRGLDPIAAREVRRVIEQLSREGMTILLTTHLLEEADQLSHRVAFINQGRIVACDSPRNFKLAHGRRALLVTLGRPDQQESLCEQTLNMEIPTDLARLSEWLEQGQVRAVHSQEATLEEVFLEIAGVRPA